MIVFQYSGSARRGTSLGASCAMGVFLIAHGHVVHSADETATAVAAVELGEIVVTAEKREVSLQKSALTIQVVSGMNSHGQAYPRCRTCRQSFPA